MITKLLCLLFATICSGLLNNYNYKGLVLLQSEKEIVAHKAVNLTLSGQVEFRRFLTDALYNCMFVIRGGSERNCPRKASLNRFTHACCTKNFEFLNLNINGVKLDTQESKTFLNLLNTRIDDSFEFTNEINPRDEMILIFNIHTNGGRTLIRTYEEAEYPKLQNLLYRYNDLCMLENTQATESESCPRVNTFEGVKFCCDYSDQLLLVRLGHMTLTRNDVDYLVNAIRRF